MSDDSPAETKYTLERELLCLKKFYRSPYDNFLQEQAVIHRKLNAINSLCHKLPFETLNTIFLHATTPPPRPRLFLEQRTLRDLFSSVTLASVCSRWRSVAFSTPTLWNQFEFPESLWKRQLVPFHLLSLYLDNSKYLPIHLFLSFPAKSCKNPNTSLFHPSLDHSLISNLTKIRSLSLSNPPLCWFMQIRKLSYLANLSIEWPYGIPRGARSRLQIHHCHALTCLSISNAISEDSKTRVLYQVPASLTVLDLSTTPIDICIKTMLRCPNLIEAYIDNPRDVQDVDFVNQETLQEWFTQPVVFNHLTILLWTHCSYDCAIAFLRQLRTPQLRTLRLTSEDRDFEVGIENTGIASLIQQLPTTLKTLEFEGLAFIPADILTGCLFDTRSPVEHLIASRCTLKVLSDIFKTPPGPSLDNLPQLKSLSIRDCLSSDYQELDELKSRDLEPIIESLERRFEKGDRFKLELSGFGVDWMPAAQARLRQLVEKGVHLEIIEDEGQVEWLQ